MACFRTRQTVVWETLKILATDRFEKPQVSQILISGTHLEILLSLEIAFNFLPLEMFFLCSSDSFFPAEDFEILVRTKSGTTRP
jgi:hypothetical protein